MTIRSVRAQTWVLNLFLLAGFFFLAVVVLGVGDAFGGDLAQKVIDVDVNLPDAAPWYKDAGVIAAVVGLVTALIVAARKNPVVKSVTDAVRGILNNAAK